MAASLQDGHPIRAMLPCQHKTVFLTVRQGRLRSDGVSPPWALQRRKLAGGTPASGGADPLRRVLLLEPLWAEIMDLEPWVRPIFRGFESRQRNP
jgi:hypothetical protein